MSIVKAFAGRIRIMCFAMVLFVSASDLLNAQSLPLLVESHELAALMRGNDGKISTTARDDIRIVDFRDAWVRYRFGHIPQAVYVPRNTVHDKVDGVDGRLPPVERVVADLEKAGIGSDMTVIIYDGVDGLWAARLFWALEYLGHTDVHILNGGIGKWKDDGYPVTLAGPDVSPAELTPDVHSDRFASTRWMRENFDTNEYDIIDSRSPEEYSGRQSMSKRKGHIPGAININWVQHLIDGEETPFLDSGDLEDLYDGEGISSDDDVVTYCQTGVRSSHTYFVLRVLGYTDIRVYDDSWEVWGNRSDMPLEKVDNLNR